MSDVRKMILFLLIPFLGIGGLLATAAYDRLTGEIWQVRIGGYDPRHPLYGHYLDYNYQWNWADDEQACPVDGPCCICLNSTGGSHIDPVASLHHCGDPALAACESFIRGEMGWRGFGFGEMRYYVPQAQALALERILQDSAREVRVELSVSPAGRAYRRALYIDGQALPDFLQSPQMTGRE